jgi:hypothetical protein
MNDTPNQSFPLPGESAPGAAPRSNSPFAQEIVPAPDGGDKSPVVNRTQPQARPSAVELAAMTPAQRHAANQPAAPPVITNAQRDALRAEGRWPLKPGDDGQPRGGNQQQNAPADPASLEKIKVGEVEMTKGDLADMLAQKALRDSVKVTLPTPEAYKVELPANFQAPEGVSFEFNRDDPALKQAKDFAHKHNLSQEAFSDLAGIYAATKVGEVLQFQTALKAEVAKLGSAATARVTAVQTWLQAMGGDDAGPLMKVLEIAPVAKTIFALEKMMSKWSSQGSSGFSQSGRERPQQGLSDEQWDSMSYSEKRDYGRRGAERSGR